MEKPHAVRVRVRQAVAVSLRVSVMRVTVGAGGPPDRRAADTRRASRVTTTGSRGQGMIVGCGPMTWWSWAGPGCG
ncbi:hypothetical protein GCM10009827_004000 [Dactylosporangium maewongense]|uniref:Uncharacterized protein n=1 Tax=Dactylosporangium maewongense TaxID=634393 RepID=A0ABN1ZIW7_9ACTN